MILGSYEFNHPEEGKRFWRDAKSMGLCDDQLRRHVYLGRAKRIQVVITAKLRNCESMKIECEPGHNHDPFSWDRDTVDGARVDFTGRARSAILRYMETHKRIYATVYILE